MVKFSLTRKNRKFILAFRENYINYNILFNKAMSFCNASDASYLLDSEFIRTRFNGEITPEVIAICIFNSKEILKIKEAKPLLDNFKVFTESELAENPYYRNVKLSSCDYGSFKISRQTDEKGELFLYDGSVYYPFEKGGGVIVPRIGCWKEVPSPYHVLRDNEGGIWMSITFNEINTMKDSIDECYGNVLTFGCGLGYFAYMAALKDSVSKVTIVEKDTGVISLFREKILPFFGEVGNKIEIIEADAFDYIKNIQENIYDYCFADIWDGIYDCDKYLRLKQIAGNEFRGMKMSYWLEEAFIARLYTSVCDAIVTLYSVEDSLYGYEGWKAAFLARVTGLSPDPFMLLALILLNNVRLDKE